MGRKVMVAQTRGMEVKTSGQVQNMFWNKPTDFDNRLDMIGEGDGKVEDDPQVLDLHDLQKVVFNMEPQSELESTG